MVLLLVRFIESQVFPCKITFSTLFFEPPSAISNLRCFLNAAGHTHNWPPSLYSCLTVSASLQALVERFGGGTEWPMCVSFRKTLGLLYNEKWQIYNFSLISSP